MRGDKDKNKRHKRGEELSEEMLRLSGLSKSPRPRTGREAESQGKAEAAAEEHRPLENGRSASSAHRSKRR